MGDRDYTSYMSYGVWVVTDALEGKVMGWAWVLVLLTGNIDRATLEVPTPGRIPARQQLHAPEVRHVHEFLLKYGSRQG